MNYDVYLFTCLWKEFDEQFRQRPYDEQYYLALNRFREFESSVYNDVNKGIYECVESYFNNQTK